MQQAFPDLLMMLLQHASDDAFTPLAGHSCFRAADGSDPQPDAAPQKMPEARRHPTATTELGVEPGHYRPHNQLVSLAQSSRASGGAPIAPDSLCFCMPTTQEYQKALQTVLPSLPPSYRAMLEANFRAHGHALAPGHLAVAAGYTSYAAVNLHYGKLGARISDVLGFRPSKLSLQGRPCLTFSFAEWRGGQWVLLPEVVSALRSLGWR
jgi:hypothetical protein